MLFLVTSLTVLSACQNASDSAAARAPAGSVQFVDGPSGSIAVRLEGAGPKTPVVFAHSLGGGLNQWSAQIAHLRPTRQVVALDMRGHGRSEPPRDRNYTMVAMAGDIEAVTNVLKIDRFVLIGHSMGGSVAVAFAGMHPERVAGLLLVDPNGDSHDIPRRALDPFMNDLRSPNYQLTIAAHFDTILEGADATVHRSVMEDLRSTPKQTVVNGFEAMYAFDPARWLRRYHGPALSMVTPRNNGPRSLHRITRLDHRLVLGTSHWLHMDKPDEFNATMDDFLIRADTSREAPVQPSP